MLDGEPALDVDAERRPEQRRLDVVHGQCIAREQDLHEPELDEPRQVTPSPGVDDGGSRDDDDAPAGFPDLFHLGGDRADQDLLGFSAETSLAMNVKILVCRDRSSGVTLTPWWPTTISSPGVAP